MPEEINESTFEAPKVTDMVIRSNQARLQIGSSRKPIKAIPAIPAVKGQKEIKDDEGNIIQEAVKAVKAVKAVPAGPGAQTVWLHAENEKIMDEVIARMADQGFHPPEIEGVIRTENGCKIKYIAETDKPIRAAFKKVKSKDYYNAPGLAIAADAAAQKKAEDKAKRAAEKEKEKELEAKAKEDAQKDIEDEASTTGIINEDAFDD